MCCGDEHRNSCLGARLVLVSLNMITLVLSIIVVVSCQYLTFDIVDANDDYDEYYDNDFEDEFGAGIFALNIYGTCYSYGHPLVQLAVELANAQEESDESIPDGWTKMAQAGGVTTCVVLFLSLIAFLLVLLVLKATASKVIWVITRYLWKLALLGTIMTIGVIVIYIEDCQELGCWPGLGGYMAGVNIIMLFTMNSMSACIPVLEESLFCKRRGSSGGGDAVHEAYPSDGEPKPGGRINEEVHHPTEISTEAQEDSFPVSWSGNTSAHVIEIDEDPDDRMNE